MIRGLPQAPGEAGPAGGVAGWGRGLLVLAALATLRLLGRTLRWRLVGTRRLLALLAQGEPVVVTFWHGSAPLVLLCRALPRATVLVSRSADGDLAAALLDGFGQGVVRGSSSRGGAASLRSLLRLLRAPRRPALAVDGPRGPRGRPGEGAGHLARVGGAWVVPLGASARRGTRTRSWDRALLPWPGSRAALVVGRPVRWEDAPGPDAFRAALSSRLDLAQRRALRLCGGGR